MPKRLEIVKRGAYSITCLNNGLLVTNKETQEQSGLSSMDDLRRFVSDAIEGLVIHSAAELKAGDEFVFTVGILKKPEPKEKPKQEPEQE